MVTAQASQSSSATPTQSPLIAPAGNPSAPSVTCGSGITAQALVLIGGPMQSMLYEVSDPLHPRLLCRVKLASAHIAGADSLAYLLPVTPSETDLMVHSLPSGTDTKAATFPFIAGSAWSNATEGAWRPDGSLLAYSLPAGGTDSNAEVWLYADRSFKLLRTYPVPPTDCICRFGLPPQVNAFSADGQYLVSGWPVGKGAQPFVVSRVSDRSQVHAFDLSVTQVLWDRTGHRLFLIGPSGVQAWTPEAGTVNLPGASQWTFLPSMSPDGSAVVYTAYVDQAQTELRVFRYDLATGSTRMLSDQDRSQVLFVKSGWVWYLEEANCTEGQGSCPPGGSGPSGTVFAQNLATGQETAVTFNPGDAPDVVSNWSLFQLQDIWP
jgi:WD40 repeat protein